MMTLIPELPAGPLVSAAWLVSQRGRAQLRLLDCRFRLTEPRAGDALYQEGHLPGAVHADLERVLSGPKRPGGTGGRHPLPDPGVLAAWLGAHGIGNDSPVVVYDDGAGGHGFYATRAWWLLRWLGHEAVRVLDGGLGAYLQAGGVLETGTPSPVPASFTPHVRSDLLVSAEEVAARNPDVTLIDSRAPARYRGDVEPLDPRAGHIPGAVNRDWSGALNPDGTWKPAQEQAGRLNVPDGPTVVYCGSGVSATPNLLALELMGRPLGAGNRLYAGSWSDWTSDPARPVATGDGQITDEV